MLKNPRPEEEKIIKDIRNRFVLKKELKLNCTAIKDTRNILRLEKETKTIKDRIFEILKTFLCMKNETIINQQE